MESPAAAAGRRNATVALALLSLVGMINFIDRQLLSVLAEPIRTELGLTDTQLGLLTGLSFALFYSILGIPAAMFADRTHRTRLVAAACLLWSLFTGLSGCVTQFWQLALARCGVGIGEAGGNAPSLSILSDYYPPERRAGVIGLFNLGGPVGIFLGTSVGGWTASQYGWRAAFLGVAVVGVVASALLVRFVREPRRGAMDTSALTQGGAQAWGLGRTVRYFFAHPTLRWLLPACGLAAFVNYGILNWIPAYLMRVQKMPLSEVAQWFGPAAGLSMGLGIWGGGALVNWASRRSPRAYGYVPALAMVLFAPALVLALTATSWQSSLALMMVAMVCFAAYIAPALALVQNLAPPTARATATALLLLAFNIVGLGGGPLAVGMLSDMFAAGHAPQPLQLAMISLGPVALIAALAYLALARTIDAKA